MVLKCNELNDLHKTMSKQYAFSQISLRTFKELVPFFVQERQTKWSTQCFCPKCGNGVAATKYLNSLGQYCNDNVLEKLDPNSWFEKLCCKNATSTADKLVCLRNKKSIQKCFMHKKKQKKCFGK